MYGLKDFMWLLACDLLTMEKESTLKLPTKLQLFLRGDQQ